jgi:hypothetical protein
MAIAAANVVYSGNGPTATGQVLATRTDVGNFSRTLIGNVTWTGDGATTSAVGNYIDGTAVLGFAPSALLYSQNGGADSTGRILKIVDNADNGRTFTATFATAPSAATIQFGLVICK